MPRILRSIVCLLLILCLIISWSPIRAEAVAVEASIAIGLIAMMILASAGVVYTANTTGQIQAIGNSFQTHMYQWGTSAEKLDEVDAFFNGLHLYDPGSGDDDETPHEKQVRLARGILAGITAWVASLALGMIEIEEETDTAPEGMMYYNGFLLPTLPSDVDVDAFPFFLITKGTTTYCVYYFDYEPYIKISTTSLSLRSSISSTTCTWYNGNTDKPWYFSMTKSYKINTEVFSLSSKEIIWSNFDLYDSNGELYFPASEPSPVKTEPILPNTYVGDIPDQLQNGELEPEDIPLPDINLEPYIEDGKLAPQKVIDTMSNLSTGALPYDQFLQQSTLPPEIDDGGTDTDSGTSSDTWQPPDNPGKFALDLTKYFPFCIPFDLYDLFTCLNADPVAPVIHWELPIPGGSTYPIELDLSPFDSVAQLLRRMQLLLFCVGLAIKTRDLIKG